MTAQMGMYLGWAIILVIAYTVEDIQDVVDGAYGQPMVRNFHLNHSAVDANILSQQGSLCLQVLDPKAGLGMFSFNIFAQLFVGQG